MLSEHDQVRRLLAPAIHDVRTRGDALLLARALRALASELEEDAKRLPSPSYESHLRDRQRRARRRR